MKILCIADEHPWPSRSGNRQRLDQVVRALAEAGTVELFSAVHSGIPISPPPDDLSLTRWTTVEVRGATASPSALVRSAVQDLPRRIGWRDWAPARAELRRWAAPPYDLVWYSHADTFAGLAATPALPRAFTRPKGAAGAVLDGSGHRTVVDLVDLEDWKLRSKRRDGARRPRPAGAGQAGHRLAVGLLDAVDEGRWTRLQQRIARAADVMVVCSELDRARLGAPATVIPNGYEGAADPARSPAPGAVLIMVGLFHYPPNREAAAFFVRDVLPRIRAAVPGTELRLVGRHEGHLDHLAGEAGVVVTGEVADVGVELARARAAVIPLRAGSGTRVKALEAFAYGLPVISTSVGCEGIAVTPGAHLLVSDDAPGLAEACVRVLRDDALWHRLSTAGRALYEDKYQWSDIRPVVGELARSVVGRGPLSGTPSPGTSRT